jgi:hypothetical protein
MSHLEGVLACTWPRVSVLFGCTQSGAASARQGWLCEGEHGYVYEVGLGLLGCLHVEKALSQVRTLFHGALRVLIP